jgi:transcriptional regulator
LKPWTEAEIQKAMTLKRKGLSDYEIADKLGRTYASVNVKLVRLKLEGKLPASKVPESGMPLWDKPLQSQGDAVILSDVEAPFQHSEFINRVLDLADAWGIQTLHLAGDLLHYDNLSAWGSEWTEDREDIVDVVLEIMNMLPNKKREAVKSKLEEKGLLTDNTLSGELTAARAVFRSFSSFSEIYVELGNHDDRYLRALDQALSPKELLHQIDRAADDRWKIAPYYYATIETERGTFRVTHPRGAAQKTAIDLAIQFHQHVIMGHSHRWAVNRDPSGKFWAIQQGHCVDEKRLAYVQQRDAKRDAHLNGATIIRGGYPFVLSPESPWELLRRM